MKTIKPMKLSLLTRSFENDQQAYLAVGILVFFRFDAPEDLLPEVALWKFVAEELGKDGILDEGMPKERAEFLIAGKAYPVGGRAAPACAVRVKVAGREKSLYAVGNRVWRRGVPSDPEPFTEMPITWENAFGGEGFDRNPAGKGFAPLKNDKGERTDVHPLPNIEDPRRLITSPRDRPEAVGFRPIDLVWPQRQARIGTYDLKWLNERFPGFAKDLDWTFFNTAPEDQWLTGTLKGGEPFELEGLHPTKRLQEGRVPHVVPRCFINQQTPGGELFRELEMRLDTLWLFPHAERGVAVYHGAIKVVEDDAADVLHLIIAAEAPGQPRGTEHYQEVLRSRLDKEKGALLALKDDDLLPPEAGARSALADDDIGKLTQGEERLQRNVRKKARRQIEAAREWVRAAGLNPDEHAPPLPPEDEPPGPTLEQLPEMLKKMEAQKDAAQKELERRMAERVEATRPAAEAAGLDLDEISREWKDAPCGPPKFSAEAQLAALRALRKEAAAMGADVSEIDGYLADPQFTGRLVEGERRMREAYRFGVLNQAPAPRLPAKEAATLRAGVEALLLSGESLARRDLTGADLSNMDLTGVDLSDAFLESANLTGTNLTGANLSQAVLARADLTNAVLAKARLEGASLGGARCTNTDLSGADLTGAIADKAEFPGAVLRGARIDRLSVMGAALAGADLSEIEAASQSFLQGDFSNVRFAGANLEKATFLEMKAEGADFTGANMKAVTFVNVKAARACFRGANLEGFRSVMEIDLAQADFRGARLVQANLRGARLTGADFTGCAMDGADLSECDLAQASLQDASARGARLVRANLADADLTRADLMEAILQKAHLEGANFKDANLYAADFARIHGDSRTNLKGANQKKVRVKPVAKR